MINTDAAICSFYDGTSSVTGRGFCVGPQDAFFTSGLNTVNVDYVEDKMIHLALVYSYSNKLLSIYINGILTGVVRNTVNGTGGSFTISQILLNLIVIAVISIYIRCVFIIPIYLLTI